jgi:hypothetical protein
MWDQVAMRQNEAADHTGGAGIYRQPQNVLRQEWIRAVSQ